MQPEHLRGPVWMAIVLTGIAAIAGHDYSDASVGATPAPAPAVAPTPTAPAAPPEPDLSGRTRVGVASFYAASFAGRTMADGETMDPEGNNAASRTLPLGTTAKITNLKTGESAEVVVEDRGPYVDGRIVDLSPATARQIGLTEEQGLTRVAIAPIKVVLPNGHIKLGSGARTARRRHESTGADLG